ncbi:sulfatase-like hydrolase/transferase [Polaribacter batillariae]|uniref:Sulfatase-like hydrolase/transferase n=1 Tax=Polaribacter batillariae TaxID=2808900 RepID=A0ABX7SQC9_9FLAO|nr:sulfatase-like hydrolase/transferase [Polaribacter batillariae]QTD36425.1 sulfatase-like hydrolase/transferase [Polaribacter batillariae]
MQKTINYTLFGKKLIYIGFLLIGLQSIAQTKAKPNVIIIYTDDQGSVDLGCYGASDIYSPNIDQLAKQGTRFTQAYVAAPVCAPSRAALLTGKYPQKAGVHGNTSHVMGSDGMPGEQYTIAELFKNNNYKTAHIGKWHLGMSKKTGPNAQGFDYSFGHLRGCIDNYSHYFYWAGPNTHDLYENGKEVFYEGKYFPDLASDKALKFVEDHKEHPFFMYYAINMPHYPYQPTKKWREYYKDVEKPRGDYAAFISTIDERIGFLMDKLDALGIREETIIIYQSDNGYSTETRAFGGGGNSGPYRGGKSSLFEGGIRLPTIISWKNTLPKNRVNNEFLMNVDWLPTLANLCELKNIPKDIDGLDLSQMIKNSNSALPRKEAFWKYGNQWAVRKGNWKLIGYPKDTSHKGKLDATEDALFLSNLSEDVSEMKNLAHKYPQKVKELTAAFLQWEFGYEDDVPKKVEIIEHLGKSKKIKSIKELHKKYKNIDVLLDGKRGYKDFRSGQWVGQEGADLAFVIDLKKTQPITTIHLGYLQDPTNWIYPPINFEVSFSKDGTNFNKTTVSNSAIKTTKKGSLTGKLSIATRQKARFVKIHINGFGKIPKNYEGEGNNGWFFVDEIIVE